MTILYNTTTEKLGQRYDPQYLVDGKPGKLPDHIVELAIVETERPLTTETQTASQEWVIDTEQREYRHEWTVRELITEEIRAKYSRITKLQGLLMCENLGIYDTLQSTLQLADKSTMIAFENALYWDRESPLIVSLGQELGMTDQQLDDFFYNASKIEVE